LLAWTLGVFVHATLDDLVIALSIEIDDLLR
jgi:hypothetical protein